MKAESRLFPALAAILALVPNLQAAIPGLTYYFRDFVLTYYPLRHFLVSELRGGHWPFWNPYLGEGSAVLPMLYPPELLQALVPGPAFASWLLTLHLPMAALGAYALAREIGCCRWGALASGAAYSMGGLAPSSLSLHWYLQALALAPLVALVFRRAAVRGRGWTLGAAGLLAVAVSTLAAEFVAQGLLLGVVLGLVAAPSWRGAGRMAFAAALGVGLAGLPVALVLGILGESLRGSGFPAAIAESAPHPVTLVQVLIPDLYGSVSEPLRFWWGGRLFPGGSPYFMSLYLGPIVVALAAAGAVAGGGRDRLALFSLGALGLLCALGPAGGLARGVAALVPWTRYSVKAFLLTHAAASLLAGLGATRLREGRGMRPLVVSLALTAGLAAALGSAVVLRQASLARWLDISPASASAMRRILTRECATSLAFAGAAGLALAGVRRKWLAAPGAAAVLLVLAVGDLVQGGVGLNRMTSTAFFRLPPGLAPFLPRPGEGRLFSFGADRVPALEPLLRERRPGVERMAFQLSREVLVPFCNLLDDTPVAEGPDRLSFIPNRPLLAPWEQHPAWLPRILPRLRSEGVSRLLSLDPIVHPEALPRGVVPTGIDSVAVHVYDVKEPWPQVYVACRVLAADGPATGASPAEATAFDPARDVALETPGQASCTGGKVEERARATDEVRYVVEADGQGYLVARDSYTPSWRASVDGRPAQVLRANGRHRAVPVAAGRHQVRVWYEPPGLVAGAALSAASLVLAAGLFVRERRR
jgi:hypothetical protein